MTYFAIGGLIALSVFAAYYFIRWLFKFIGRKLADLFGGSPRL